MHYTLLVNYGKATDPLNINDIPKRTQGSNNKIKSLTLNNTCGILNKCSHFREIFWKI